MSKSSTEIIEEADRTAHDGEIYVKMDAALKAVRKAREGDA